ncbi:MAG: hypothetical protein ACREGF_06220, partial [Candidatus Saccharimonadales bacterium]
PEVIDQDSQDVDSLIKTAAVSDESNFANYNKQIKPSPLLAVYTRSKIKAIQTARHTLHQVRKLRR